MPEIERRSEPLKVELWFQQLAVSLSPFLSFANLTFGTNVGLESVESVGECVDGVDDELNFRVHFEVRQVS